MIIKLEVQQWWKPTLICALILAFFLAMVIGMYPLMAKEMSGIIAMIQSLGVFSKALKIENLMIDQLIGFYSMEMENMLGISGAMFAGYMGGKLLAKEENLKTNEFLFTHPIKRGQVFLKKLWVLMLMVTFFNVIIASLAWLSLILTNQTLELTPFIMMHMVMWGVHIILGCMAFAISVFFPLEGMGMSMGIVFVLYTLNILINIDERLDVIKWMTPFQFAYASEVLNHGVNYPLIATNALITLILLIIAYFYYLQKDLK